MKPQRRSEEFEWRTFTSEIRQVAGAGEKPKLAGLAVPYNRETVLIPANAMFEGSPEIREVIMPGAFTKSLRESEQWALWAHDPNIVLGRKGNGTLRLSDGDNGLESEIDPPDTALVRDMVIAPIERGDVKGMSFRFWPLREDTETREDGNVILFKVREAGIQEVSPTPFPAYTTTTISARSKQRIDEAVEEFKQRRQAAEIQSAPGQSAHPEQAEKTGSTPASDHPEQSAPIEMRHLDDELNLRLDLAKRKHRLIAA